MTVMVGCFHLGQHSYLPCIGVGTIGVEATLFWFCRCCLPHLRGLASVGLGLGLLPGTRSPSHFHYILAIRIAPSLF